MDDSWTVCIVLLEGLEEGGTLECGCHGRGGGREGTSSTQSSYTWKRRRQMDKTRKGSGEEERGTAETH